MRGGGSGLPEKDVFNLLPVGVGELMRGCGVRGSIGCAKHYRSKEQREAHVRRSNIHSYIVLYAHM
jgi:hypothetical protein